MPRKLEVVSLSEAEIAARAEVSPADVPGADAAWRAVARPDAAPLLSAKPAAE